MKLWTGTSLVAAVNSRVAAGYPIGGTSAGLAVLGNVLTDSHFKTRDRMGRLLTFMARLQQDGLASLPQAVGVDEQSGVGVSLNKSAVVFGPGAGAYFLNVTNTTVRTCTSGSPLTYTNIATQRVSTGQSFNLATWSGSSTNYSLSVKAGVLASTTAFIY